MGEIEDNPADGAPVDQGETLLRFAPPKQWDQLGMPTTAALTMRANEDGLSVYLNELLAARNLGAADVIVNRTGYGVFGMGAVDVLRTGCEVVHNPLADDKPAEIGYAHALIRPPGDKIKWKLARASLLKAATVKITPAAM